MNQMTLSRLSLAFALLASILVQSVQSYRIDKGCSDRVTTLLREAINDAHDMAQHGLEIIEARDRGDYGNQVWEELIGNLFASPDTKTQDIKLSKVKKAFQGILQNMKTEVSEGVEPAVEDFVIYCDTSRFKEVHEEGKEQFLDTITQEEMKLPWANCMDDLTDKFTLLSTVVVKMHKDADGFKEGDERYSQMQLCKWVLQYAEDLGEKTPWYRPQGGWGKRIAAFRGLNALAGKYNTGVWKMIDVSYKPLAKTVLHEMLHTRAWPFILRNTKRLRGRLPAYGWARALKFAKERTRLQPVDASPIPNFFAADINADTVALFGMIASMMHENPGSRVTQDGAIVKSN